MSSPTPPAGQSAGQFGDPAPAPSHDGGHGAAISNSEAAKMLGDAIAQVQRVIVGQEHMCEQLMVSLLAKGHCLLEGVPGVAKTLAVRSFATVVGGEFARIQFTPDLVPSDIVGTRIYRATDEKFQIELGPGLRQLRPGRRDQPGPGQGAVGHAGADGGEAGVDRRHHLPRSQAVHRHRDPEPGGVRRRLPAA